MEKRGRLRYLVPILVIVVIALFQPSLPQANLAAFIERLSGDYSFRELSNLLPEGIESIAGSTTWEKGAMLVARTNADRVVLAEYNAAEGRLEGAFLALPPNYAVPRSMARSGNLLLLGGESLGTAPVLGLYDGSSRRIDDVSDVLPYEAESISLIVGGGQTFLTVIHNGTGYTPGIYEPGSRSWTSLDAGTFADLASVTHGTWNGTVFFVAGAKLGGIPTLLQVNPGGGVVDLSGDLPDDIEELDYLVWTGASLYLLGRRHSLEGTRASLAVYQPAVRTSTSLSSALRDDYTALRAGAWNGYTLSLLAETADARRLIAYHPANDTALYLDDILIPNSGHRDLVQYSETLLLIGGDETPFIGHLNLSDWRWEDKGEVFEGPFQTILHAEVVGGRFVVAGTRRSSGALALIDPSMNSLEDKSEVSGLDDTALIGAVGDEDWILLAGENANGGALYGYGTSNGSLQDLTPKVPQGMKLAPPSRIGGVYAIPGHKDGESGLLVYDRALDSMTDLGAQVQRYFDPPIGLAAGETDFLIFGNNDRGPALALLDASTLNITFLGTDLDRLYGPSGLILSASWSGNIFLIGGTIDGRPLLGAWNPAGNTYEELSREVPEDFGSITTIAWTGDGFALGGQGTEGASIGAYYPRNRAFIDLRGLLPPSYTAVNSLAARGSDILVVSTLASSSVSIGVLRLSPSSTLWDGLPSVVSEPAGAVVLGLSVTFASTVAYILGRRTKRRKVPNPPPPAPYPEVPLGPPEEYYPGYPEEFEAIPHWYEW